VTAGVSDLHLFQTLGFARQKFARASRVILINGAGQNKVRGIEDKIPSTLPDTLRTPLFSPVCAAFVLRSTAARIRTRSAGMYPPRTAAHIAPGSRAGDGTATRHAVCFMAVRALVPQPAGGISCLYPHLYNSCTHHTHGRSGTDSLAPVHPPSAIQLRRGAARRCRASQVEAVVFAPRTQQGSGGSGSKLHSLASTRQCFGHYAKRKIAQSCDESSA
jgi:hypothetical protein